MMKTLFFIILCALAWLCPVLAEKVMVYDEEKGIVFIEKSEVDKPRPAAKKTAVPNAADLVPAAAVKSTPAAVEPAARGIPKTKSLYDDIHANRIKDPPQVYFNSGLEYFKNGDYQNALRNFEHADSLEPTAEYLLWCGKTVRQMNDQTKMRTIMNKIVQKYPNSTVADDALFENAFYLQSHKNYDSAMILYRALAEQYPFGTSYSNNESFREVARAQNQSMETEITLKLNQLGFDPEDRAQAISSFQRNAGLVVTGFTDSITLVNLNSELARANDTSVKKAHMRKKLIWYGSIGTAGLGFIALALAIIQTFTVSGTKKRILKMQESIAHLQIDKKI